MACGNEGGLRVVIAKGAINSLKSSGSPVTMECMFGTIYTMVQRV
jgi:hypothetical protein